MKAVLISIQPKWCEKIASGKKTIEVRKTEPSIYTPFKVYIYCTKTKNKWSLCDYEGAYQNSEGEIVYAQQHVIGEFVCDWIEEFDCELYNDGSDEEIRSVWYDEDDGERYTEIIAHAGDRPWLLRHACMSWDEFKAYMGEGVKTFYAWHISQLKIYNKSKELSEFVTAREKDYCDGCGVAWESCNGDYHCTQKHCDGYHVSRAPQSWCYVQELEE